MERLFWGFSFFSIVNATVFYLIGSRFSRQRARELEVRNKEFSALHRMSSTIRSALSLHHVIDQILLGVLEGLRFDSVPLLRFDDEGAVPRVHVHVPKDHPRIAEVEAIFGMTLEGLEFPLQHIENAVFEKGY